MEIFQNFVNKILKERIGYMSKIIWKPGTFINPVPVVMVTCGTMEESNIITVAWTGTINSNPPMCYISVRPNRHSYNMIKEKQEFVINLISKDLVRETDWCGCRTGAKFDKFKEMNLTKEKANFVKCPMIKESPVSIDADEKYIDLNGAFDIQKCNLVSYQNGGYYMSGQKIGKFGFSVEKKKRFKFMNIFYTN